MTTVPNTEEQYLPPVNVLDQQGKYVLDHPDIAALVEYLWTGVFIKTTKEDYLKLIGISAFPSVIEQNINALMVQYGLINTHCKKFKNDTYPKIVQLASTIYNYATLAGGKAEDSFYAMIIDYGNKLNEEVKKTPQDAAKVKEYSDTINELIDYMLDIVKELKTDAATAKGALEAFDKECRTDKENLSQVQTPIHNKLVGISGSGGEVERLTADLKAKQAELDADQKEYEQDVIIATTTLCYCWAWPIGPIVAPIVAGIYGDKAVKMKATCEAIQGIIDNEKTQLAVAIKIAADLLLIDKDMDSIIAAVGAAIKGIETLVSAWSQVEGNLENVSRNVANINKGTIARLRTSTAGACTTAWDTVAVAVDKYRDKAYVGAPVQLKLKEVITAVSKAAKPA